VPEDRILLESDAHTASDARARMEAACAAVADAKGWDVEHLARVANRNARAFLASQGREGG